MTGGNTTLPLGSQCHLCILTCHTSSWEGSEWVPRLWGAPVLALAPWLPETAPGWPGKDALWRGGSLLLPRDSDVVGHAESESCRSSPLQKASEELGLIFCWEQKSSNKANVTQCLVRLFSWQPFPLKKIRHDLCLDTYLLCIIQMLLLWQPIWFWKRASVSKAQL